MRSSTENCFNNDYIQVIQVHLTYLFVARYSYFPDILTQFDARLSVNFC